MFKIAFHDSSPYPKQLSLFCLLWLISTSADCIADMGRLQHKCNRLRLRLLATCSITITNKQNHNVIDYDYIVSNHDYNREYTCLPTSSERKQNPFEWFHLSIVSDNIRYESIQ